LNHDKPWGKSMLISESQATQAMHSASRFSPRNPKTRMVPAEVGPGGGDRVRISEEA
jgi:hypothetical protein